MTEGEIIEVPNTTVHLSLGRNSESTDVAARAFLVFGQVRLLLRG